MRRATAANVSSPGPRSSTSSTAALTTAAVDRRDLGIHDVSQERQDRRCGHLGKLCVGVVSRTVDQLDADLVYRPIRASPSLAAATGSGKSGSFVPMTIRTGQRSCGIRARQRSCSDGHASQCGHPAGLVQ